MKPVDDQGKVWGKGFFRPVFAVRVGDKIFIPGAEEDEEVTCWREERFLVADCLNRNRNRRTLRRLPLDLVPEMTGTLFSGFDATRHADIVAVHPGQEGVEEYVIEGEPYRTHGIENLSPEEARTWFVSACGDSFRSRAIKGEKR
ncbi:MAG: hypothetical protein COV67_03930 [Nitrospinae bacterium CG11_big_fil_rev_8_21_14_0_20_56_8]|nr:MAG: hypothetical protein COV67_03930 [Nitrospinae bacterium CG11_big_fil_rev_8_21_14_0_20_56_8]